MTDEYKYSAALPVNCLGEPMGDVFTTGVTGSFVVPTAEGIRDAMDALKAASDVGKWTLIAPDGRVWFSPKPRELFAVLSAVLLQDPETFRIDHIISGESPATPADTPPK